MTKKESRNKKRIHRKRRIRAKISGTALVPRVCVFKSLRFFYAQAIDDEKENTLAAIDSRKEKKEESLKMMKQLGEKFAQILQKKDITKIVFDRNGYPYKGKIKSFAEGLRKKGIIF